MKACLSKQYLDNFVNQYSSHVKSSLNQQEKAFAVLTEQIKRQIALKKMEFESSKEDQEKIIEELKDYTRELLQSSKQCIISPATQNKIAENKQEKVLSWFKNLNDLKKNNQNILRKRIQQLEEKLQNINNGKSKAQIERYKKVNAELVIINTSLNEKLQLLNQESSKHSSLNSSCTNFSDKKDLKNSKISIEIEFKEREKELMLQLSELQERRRKDMIRIKQLQQKHDSHRILTQQLEKEKKERKRKMSDLQKTQRSKLNFNSKEAQEYYEQTENSFKALKKQIEELNKALKLSESLNQILILEKEKSDEIMASQLQENQVNEAQISDFRRENTSLKQNISSLSEVNYQQFLILEQQRIKLIELIQRQQNLENIQQKYIALEKTNSALRSQIILNHEQTQKKQKKFQLQMERLKKCEAKLQFENTKNMSKQKSSAFTQNSTQQPFSERTVQKAEENSQNEKQDSVSIERQASINASFQNFAQNIKQYPHIFQTQKYLQ